MKLFKNTLLAAVVGLSLVVLAGCDAAEQSARDLASKAEQAALALAQEKLKESVSALNEQVDKVQQKAETLIGQPPAAEEKPGETENPKAEDSAPATIET